MAVDATARGMAAAALQGGGGGGGGQASAVSYDNTASGLTATNVQAAIDELCESIKDTVQIGSITISTTWTGAASPYSQVVTVTGASVTANSKIDLQPSAVQFASLAAGGVTAMLVENDNGTLTVYAIGNTPSAEMTLQCTVTEV